MMRNFIFAVLPLCAACSAAQMQQAQTDLEQATLVIDKGACDAQAAANDATTILTAAGDTAGAAQTAEVSAVAGTACMTLAAPAASGS